MALVTVAGLVVVGWLAGTPWLAEHWPRVLAVGLFLVVFVAPRWLVPARSAASLAAVTDPAARGRLEDERLKLQHGVRIGLLQAVAGVAVIAAVAATWQQLDIDRRLLAASWRRRARSRPPSGSPGPSTSWAASSWTCARVASTSWSASPPWRRRSCLRMGVTTTTAPPAGATGSGGLRGAEPPAFWDRVQVFEILSAYVRTTSHRPPVGPGEAAAALQVSQPDVHAAVVALARRTVLAGDPPLDLNGSRLPKARLGWARLAGADLRGADLQYADLAGTHLEQAVLCGTQRQGADLSGAHLAGARASTATAWPDGFDWRAAGARLVEQC